MFSKEVLNIFSNPVNAGRIKKPDAVEDLFNSNKTAHIEFSMRIENDRHLRYCCWCCVK